MMRTALTAIVWIFGLCGGVSQAVAETRFFDLSHRPAAEVAEAVRTILGNDAKVTAVERTLVVNAEPHQLSAVADLLAKLDRPPKMLRVTIAQSGEQTSGEVALGVDGRVSSGATTVVLGKPPAPGSSGTVAVSGENGRLRVSGESSVRSELRTAEQFVTVLEGYPARISVGQRLPVTERWLLLARKHARLVESVSYQSVDTGFEVQSDVIGAMVRLTVHPFMAFQDGQRRQDIRFQELTTTVNVPLGHWVDLGGALSGADEVGREILAAGRHSAEARGTVRVRVEVPSD